MLETGQIDRRVIYVSRDAAKTDGTTFTKQPEGKFKVNASAWERGKTILADQVARKRQLHLLHRPRNEDPRTCRRR